MHQRLGYRVVHLIPHLQWAAGRYVVETAVAQVRLHPGRVAIIVSADGTWPLMSDDTLVRQARETGVVVEPCGDFFDRRIDTLRAAALELRDRFIGAGSWVSDSVAHAHTAMAATVARWAGAPRVVMTVHGGVRPRPAEIALQDALAGDQCDTILAGWPHVAEWLAPTLSPGRLVVVPYTAGLPAMRPQPGGGHRIVYTGEFGPEAGVEDLVTVMPLVWQRVPDATLHILGDTEKATALREQARHVDPGGTRIVFERGVWNELPDLSAFDVWAAAPKGHVLPHELYRAMATGLPVVSTDVGDGAAVIRASRNGLLIPAGDLRDLALAMTVLLTTTALGHRELGDCGRARIDAELTPAAHAGALESVYDGTRQAEVEPWTPPKGPVRLHLGSGTERREGWVNVDSRPEAEPDIVARVHQLPMVPDASVDVIEACHLFEHLPFHEAMTALREWARVLKPGGELFLEMPNFEASLGIIGTATESQGYDLGMVGIYGWPPDIEAYGEAMSHRWGWTPAALSERLVDSGFADVRILPVTQTYRPAARFNRDFRIGASRAV